MATQLQIRRGTTAQMNAFTGAEGELAVNTTTDTLHVHDGATAGGKALARADGSNIATYAGSFTTLAASSTATLNTLVSSGATLTGGTINGVTVGASTPSTGAFTTLAASGAVTLSSTLAVTGTVSIGVSNPLDYYVKDLVVSGSSEGGITIASSATTYNNYLAFADSNVGDARFAGLISYMHSIDAMGFRTASVERMRIDSSGSVGIGTTVPTQSDTNSHFLYGGGSNGFNLSATEGPIALSSNVTINSGEKYVFTGFASKNYQLDGAHVWMTAASGSAGAAISFSERMRIDSAGNVGINNSIASSFNGGANNLVVGSGSGAEGMTIYGGAESNIFFADGTAGTAAYIGRIEYSHSSNMMKFYVNNLNAMNIDSAGNLLVGTSSASGSGASAGKQVIQFAGASVNGLYLDDTRTSSGTDNAVVFGRGTTYCGKIETTTAPATNYVSASDQRLKENIADADDAGSKIDAIQVRKYDWIGDGTHQEYGLVAQELQPIAPLAVSGNPESEEMMGVDYSKLVPMMLKEIQMLRTRVAELENN